MDRRAKILFMLVVLASFVIRPNPPQDTRFVGGSLEGAMKILADGAASKKSAGRRALEDDYEHWSDSQESASADPLSTVGLTSAQQESPVIAGLIGIASATGLRDLAAVSLYLLSEKAEHTGDWELCDLCLRAIPLVDPHFVDAYLIRAFFFFKSNPAKAEEILLRAVRWNPEDWELWNDLAWLHLRRTKAREADPHKALKYLEAAVAVRHPYFVERLYAYVLAHLGKKNKARSVFERMLAGEDLPQSDRVLAERGLAELQRGYDRLKDRYLSRDYQEVDLGHHHHHHHHHGHHHGHHDEGGGHHDGHHDEGGGHHDGHHDDDGGGHHDDGGGGHHEHH